MLGCTCHPQPECVVVTRCTLTDGLAEDVALSCLIALVYILELHTLKCFRLGDQKNTIDLDKSIFNAYVRGN